jgi:hypothetical protein
VLNESRLGRCSLQFAGEVRNPRCCTAGSSTVKEKGWDKATSGCGAAVGVAFYMLGGGVLEQGLFGALGEWLAKSCPCATRRATCNVNTM